MWTNTTPLSTAGDCRVAVPSAPAGPLPLVYLLHGQFDVETDWWSDKGQLAGILTGMRAPPMLLVMPFGARVKRGNARDQEEPAISEFIARFELIEAAVENEYRDRINGALKAVLGISMGGKQSIALLLTAGGRGISALGVLSGKLQGSSYGDLRNFVEKIGRWPQDLGKRLLLYFHYCGKGGGDSRHYEGNRTTCTELGGELRTQPNDLPGDHNWWIWRRQLAEFFQRLVAAWQL